MKTECFSEVFPEQTAHYRQGQLHGDVIYYYPEGETKTREKSVFEHDICTEEFTWDEDGKLTHYQALELGKFQRVMLENSRRRNE